MTSAIAVENRTEQLDLLRHRIAAVSGRMSRGHSAPHPADQLLPMSESLAELLPMGLPKGAVVVASGARSLPVAVTAGVSASGCYVAVVGHPGIGLLAAVE
ncbi:MAG TPA: hypothetical protein VMU34_14595, partial [Mycobacterium sp.]|nr:hypothetical protein [Mycobacterium sp.]